MELAATAWLVLPHSGPHLILRLLQGWLVGSSALPWAAAVVVLLRRKAGWAAQYRIMCAA